MNIKLTKTEAEQAYNRLITDYCINEPTIEKSESIFRLRDINLSSIRRGVELTRGWFATQREVDNCFYKGE